MTRRLRLAAISTALALAGAAFAQDDPAPNADPQPADATPADEETPPPPARDPFETPRPIRDAARLQGGPNSVQTAQRAPLELRALLILRDRPPGAILAIDGQPQIVRAGDALNVQGPGGTHLLIVDAIDPSGVSVRWATPDDPEGVRLVVR